MSSNPGIFVHIYWDYMFENTNFYAELHIYKYQVVFGCMSVENISRLSKPP